MRDSSRCQCGESSFRDKRALKRRLRTVACRAAPVCSARIVVSVRRVSFRDKMALKPTTNGCVGGGNCSKCAIHRAVSAARRVFGTKRR